MSSSPRTLAELLAAAQRRKHDEIRARLGIPESMRTTEFQLESLAYLLGERSGQARVKLDGDTLKVGEPGAATSIPLRGEAIDFLLGKWGIAREAASQGVTIELKDGRRIAA